MHRANRHLVLLSLCFLLAGGVCACAEEAEEAEQTDSTNQPVPAKAEEPVEPAPESANPATSSADSIQPPKLPAMPGTGLSGPDVFLLPDKEGKLRKVLGFRYDDFRRAWLENQLTAVSTPPKFALQSVTISGTTTARTARLRLEFQILSSAAQWLSVPLQMPKLVVQKVEINQQRKGECLVFDSQRQGYVLWLQGRSGEERTIVLEGLVPLQQGSAESAFALRLPPSVRSKLTLDLPMAEVQVEAGEAAAVSEIASHAQGTRVRLEGLAIPMHISWRRLQREMPRGEAVLEAVEQSVVQINRRRLRYETTLRINSFGSPVDRVRLQLPPGATLQEVRVPYQEVPNLAKTPLVGGSDGPEGIATIELTQPLREPWTLHLVAEQEIEDSQQDNSSRLTGFQVLGAYRQSGTVALQLEDQLQAYYDLQGDVEQIRLDELPPRNPQQPRSAGFSYSRFPWSLKVHSTARQRRVRVRPQFHLRLGENRTRLEVVLEYHFAGARNFAIKLKTHGWKLSDEPIESGGTIDSDRLIHTSSGELVLPMVNPDTQRAKLSFTLLRDAQLGDVAIPLPEPVGTFVGPGSLTVSPASSLRVVPDASTLAGMSLLAASGEATAARNGQDEVFRYRTFLPRTTFGAQVDRRERRVAVHAQTVVEVDQSAAQVAQQFRYEIDYRPAEQLVLRLPWAMWRNESLTAKVDGKQVQLSLGSFDEAAPTDELRGRSDRQVVVPLSQPVQGSLLLEIGYEVLVDPVFLDSATPLALPLAVPEDSLVTNAASISASESVRVTLQPTSGIAVWQPRLADERASASETGLDLSSEESPEVLPLELQLVSPEEQAQSILERAWLQTWLVGSVRQDRAVFRFRPQRSKIVVRLPPEIAQQPLELLLDHQTVPYQRLDDNRIAVALSLSQQQGSHTLELRYQQPVSLSGWETLRASPPKLECRSTGAQVIWQLILPSSWCATSVPKGLAAEYWVGWKGFRWGRQPTCSQADLQLWTQASPALAPPPSSVQSIFRSPEEMPAAEIAVMPRWWLNLTGGLAAFGIGLLGMYTSWARQRSFWLAIAVFLALLVASYPEAVVLAIQTLLLGSAMTLVAVLLRRAFQRPAGFSGVSSIGPTSMTSPTTPWSKSRDPEASPGLPTIQAPKGGSPP